jgi:LuxR family transcriptional regulator, maltose regulon positive regulatory protein
VDGSAGLTRTRWHAPLFGTGGATMLVGPGSIRHMTPASAARARRARTSPHTGRATIQRDAPDSAETALRTPAPALRAGLVPRDRLVARLAAARDAPLALAVAPAGYGKTSVLAQWAAEDPRPFAWITLDPDDDDPVRLIASLALALDEVEPVGCEFFARSARGGHAAATLVGRLARCLAGRSRPFVLVLDDAHVLAAPETFAAIATVVAHMPAGSTLALASRTEPELLPVGRLRAERRVVELRARDLVMTRAESTLMLVGLGLRPADVDTLVARTEGWPAGLCLAALALREQPDHDAALARFGGDDRFVADYLREEVLAGLPRETVQFLMRTSVLDELTGPLCDAVAGRRGSAALLRELARADVMLVALDRTEGRYRYHGLLAGMLRAELRRLDPDHEAEAHRRASAWHAARHDSDRAIGHAIASGDDRIAGELLWAVAPEHVTAGRHPAVRRWLQRFTPERVAAEPGLALTRAAGALADGDLDLVEHTIADAERALGSDAARLPTAETAIAAMRALAARDGLAATRDRAAAVAADARGEMPWAALASFTGGVAAHLTGDGDGARALLEDGARGAAVAAPAVQALCLAQLGVIALDDGDPGTADVCISRARGQVDRVGLGDEPISALVFAAAALDRAHRGRVDEARRDVREGARLLGMLAGFAAWYEAETRLLLARAALRLGDLVVARTLLADAETLVPRVRDAIVLRAWLDDCRERAESFSATKLPGPSTLTTAELRVLCLLPTHLSFREIAGRLHVSANTIKTQAHAVYRKLDASSRTEAVAHARQVGLLDA